MRDFAASSPFASSGPPFVANEWLLMSLLFPSFLPHKIRHFFIFFLPVTNPNVKT